jgi:hypothetical protein
LRRGLIPLAGADVRLHLGLPWLERDTGMTAAETPEISRLRGESESLLKIIGH